MYKIDDIIKLDLSNKKQYSIAKEILDRYILNESEKEGLLEGIKNKCSSYDGSDDGEYRYFVLKKSNEIGPYFLLGATCESKNIMFGLGKTREVDFNASRDVKLLSQEIYTGAIKVDLNINILDENNFITPIKNVLDDYLEYNDIFMEITKEEYEQKSEILKYTNIPVSDRSLNSEDDAKFFYNALTKIYNKYRNERFFDDVCYNVFFNENSYYRISAISNFDGEGFSLKGYIYADINKDESECVYVTNNEIRLTD